MVCEVDLDDITIGVLTPKDNNVFQFAAETSERFDNLPLIRKAYIKVYIQKEKLLTVLFLSPMIKTKAIFLYASSFIIITAFIFDITFLFFVPLGFAVASFFQSPSFVFLLLKKGLRKRGVEGKISRVCKTAIIRRILDDGTR